MSDRMADEIQNCNFCGRSRSDLNSANWLKHLEACKKRNTKKETKIEKKRQKLEEERGKKRKLGSSGSGGVKLSKFLYC